MWCTSRSGVNARRASTEMIGHLSHDNRMVCFKQQRQLYRPEHSTIPRLSNHSTNKNNHDNPGALDDEKQLVEVGGVCWGSQSSKRGTSSYES
eukprot:3621123-Rhodomonas_salina.2